MCNQARVCVRIEQVRKQSAIKCRGCDISGVPKVAAVDHTGGSLPPHFLTSMSLKA